MTSLSITTGTAESFKTLISDEFIYVDKTGPISALASQKGSFLLTRPRRMGKSTMVSTLEFLFSNGQVTGKDLAWDDKWSEPYRYFVFHFDFSLACEEESKSSVGEFKSALLSDLKDYADYFGFKMPKEKKLSKTFKKVILKSVKKLLDESFLAAHPELAHGERPLRNDKVVLLIDEYDAPLTEVLEYPKEFNKLRRQYKGLFKAIKTLNCFRFVFITGVSSYAQTSIFSGPNQFENISLYNEYATCCGYTRDEIEHYFADQLVNAQKITGLNHDELLNALSYHYDGYTYSKLDPDKNRVFSPVSVSLFLNRPEEGFDNYWAKTGALSPFFLKMMKLCNKAIASKLLQTIYPTSKTNNAEVNEVICEVVQTCFPIFSLAIDKANSNLLSSQLIQAKITDLTVKIDDIDPLSEENAIAVLFQSGYLSIKKIEGKTAYLGLANHEVAEVLLDELDKQIKKNNKQISDTAKQLYNLYVDHARVFDILHQGGQTLADFINQTFNLFLHKDIFKEPNSEKVVSSVISLPLKISGYTAACEVESMLGRADLIIYKPNSDTLVPDVVIEFKLARCTDNILSLLDEGSKQVADRDYGMSFLNSDPHRYCIVLSNAIKGVGAISRVHRDGSYTTEYKNPMIGANGKVPVKDKGCSSSSKAKPSDSSTTKKTTVKAKPSVSSTAKKTTVKAKPSVSSTAKKTTRGAKTRAAGKAKQSLES